MEDSELSTITVSLYKAVTQSNRETAINVYRIINQLIDSGWSTEDIQRYCNSQIAQILFYIDWEKEKNDEL